MKNIFKAQKKIISSDIPEETDANSPISRRQKDNMQIKKLKQMKNTTQTFKGVKIDPHLSPNIMLKKGGIT